MVAAVLYQRKRQKIGLTALIDVVFILLMFFMLTSTFIQSQQMDMKTPVAQSAVTPALATVVARLDAGGVISVNGQRIDDLATETLAALPWYAAAHPVVLVPDGNVTVQGIVRALDQLAAADIKQLTLGNVRDE